jgi:hypothetical protein
MAGDLASGVLLGWNGDGHTAYGEGSACIDTGHLVIAEAGTNAGGRYLYVQTGGSGIVDEFAVGGGASLTEIGASLCPARWAARGSWPPERSGIRDSRRRPAREPPSACPVAPRLAPWPSPSSWRRPPGSAAGWRLSESS